MPILIMKASDDYWFRIKVCDSIKDLYKEIGSFVVKPNFYKGHTPEDICKYWEGMTTEKAKIVAKCDLEITIYDDYIE